MVLIYKNQENGMTSERERLEQVIHDHFDKIVTQSGYDHDGCYNLDTQTPVVAESLGRLFFDYMVASVYDMSWEGFSDQELESIGRLLEDMAVAQKNM